ncbi:MAG TPA: thioredoxin family protein [Bacteroidales bacterium]|nr:thioredoxin family protein [Bacteroidales bacterium]
MKKLRAITTVFAMFVVFSFANAQAVFEAAKTQATKENKKVLLYFSGSDWCAPCMKFKKTFIQNENFKSFADKNLVLLNADFPRKKDNRLSKELTEQNEQLAGKYNPQGAFPMILLLDSTGKVLKKWDGCPDGTVEEFIKALN